MTTYKSIPHKIEAFQFSGKRAEPKPQWFWDAVKVGRAMVTINSKDRYITIVDDSQMEKVWIDDWVCYDPESDKFYKLKNEAFRKRYVEA